jgi:hypothetical protein
MRLRLRLLLLLLNGLSGALGFAGPPSPRFTLIPRGILQIRPGRQGGRKILLLSWYFSQNSMALAHLINWIQT